MDPDSDPDPHQNANGSATLLLRLSEDAVKMRCVCRLSEEAHRLLVRSLCNVLLLSWPGLQEQKWEDRKKHLGQTITILPVFRIRVFGLPGSGFVIICTVPDVDPNSSINMHKKTQKNLDINCFLTS